MPSNVSLQGIEFSIKGTSDEASKSVQKLTQELNALKDALKKSDGIGGLATSLKKFENINTTMLSVANTILKEMSQLDFTNIREAAEGIKDIAAAARQVANIGKSESPVEQIVGEPDKLRTALSYVQQLGHAFGTTLKVGLSGIKLAAKGLGSLMLTPFKQALPKVMGFAKGLTGVVSSFKRILGYRIIRSIIKQITQGFQEGVKNLYGWSKIFGGATINGKNFASTMDSISTSLAYFKNSIGAAVAPLISALAPAIDFVIDKAVALINILNQLLARLGGATSWNKAIKKAQEYDDSISGAGGAAKKAMEYLAPFDELNVLPDPKSGGGGGNNTDYSGMFEETTEFMEGIADFADALREKVANADWQGLGELLGGKVNELVNMIDFAGIGAKIGGYINALFSTRYWTLDTINFTNIGSKIAEFFNNALENIDFEIIGRTIIQWPLKIADMIIGAIEGTNWGTVAKSISDLVIGFFNELGDWFTETDFAALADSIWNGVKDAVANVDWAEVAKSIFRFIGAALGGLASYVGQLGKDIISDIWAAIVNAAAGWDSNGDGQLTGREIINGIWQGIKNAVKNVGQWIKDNIFTPFVDGIKNAFGIHSPAQSMIPYGELISEGIKEGIKAKWQNIKAWCYEHLYNPLAEAWNSLVGEDSRFALPIYGEVQEVGMGATAHVSSSGNLHGRHNGTFSLDMGGNITSLGDTLSAAKKVVNGLTAGLSTAKDNIPASQKNIKSVADVGTWYNNISNSNYKGSSRPFIPSVANVGTWYNNISNSNYNGTCRPFIPSVANVGTWYNNISNSNYNGTCRPFIPSVANMGLWYNNISNSTYNGGKYPFIYSVANMGNYKNNLGTPSFYSIANMGDYRDNLGILLFDSNAYIIDYRIDSSIRYYGDLSVDAYVNIRGQTNTPTVAVNAYYTNTNERMARGGAYYGSMWHDIPQYASGTTRAGSLFVAGEAGPEVVGHIGGRTEVLNRSQLAATMYSAVRSAMASTGFRISASPNPSYNTTDGAGNEDVLYRAFRRALDETDFGGDIELDGQTLYKAMVNRNRQNTRLTGVNAMA